MALFGIDVSTYNSSINYAAAKQAGVRFAMVKASQGHSLYKDYYLFEDSLFKTHVEGFHKVGIPVGAYHFFTATSVEDAFREADFFIETVARLGNKVSLYLACDAENYGNKYLAGLSKPELSILISMFCKRVEDSGFKACHYTNTDHIKNYIDLNLIDYPIWQAHYLSSGVVRKPEDAGDKLAIHQYTDKGQLSGVVGNYDLNFGYVPLAKLIINSRTTLEKKTIDYIAAHETGDDILMKLADRLAVRSLKSIKNDSHEKLVPLIRYHCALTEDETNHLAAYTWAVDLFKKLYFGMIV